MAKIFRDIRNSVYYGKSEYKYVYIHKNTKTYNLSYFTSISHNGYVYSKTFDNEKEAARDADLFLISKGRKPVNILKKLN